VRPSKLSKVLGVVGAGLFAIAIAMTNTGPGTSKLLSGGTLLGPGAFDTPTTSVPRSLALPAATQKPARPPAPRVAAAAQNRAVRQNGVGVIPASMSPEIGPTSAPPVAPPIVSPEQAQPEPVVIERVAPEPASPKPVPPTPPETEPKPEPAPPTVTPPHEVVKVIVVVVVVVVDIHHHHGDDAGHGAGWEHGGDMKHDHGHDREDSSDGSITKAVSPSRTAASTVRSTTALSATTSMHLNGTGAEE